MYQALFECECIAVLTSANPNATMSLGQLTLLVVPVIMLIETGSKLPFDVQDFRILIYDLRTDSSNENIYVAQLVKMVRELQETGWLGDHLFRKYRDQTTPAAAVISSMAFMSKSRTERGQ